MTHALESRRGDRTRRPTVPLPARLAALAILAVASVGCSGRAVRTGDEVVGTSITGDRDEIWSKVRAAQSTRLEALATFSSAGTSVARFNDAAGERRTEQVELRMWRVAPDRAAVRLSKVGTSFLLAGWNGPRWWALDESGERPVLRIDRLGGVTIADDPESLVSPPMLLAAIGLLPWPEATPERLEAIATDDDGRVVGVRFELPQVVWPTPGGLDLSIPGRMVVDIGRFDEGPRRIRWLDLDGDVMLDVRLDRLESVETRGRPPGGWPVLPHRAVITLRNGEETSVSLDRPLAGGEVSSRLFDLDVLRQRHPNAIVDDRSEIGDVGDLEGDDS